MYGKRQFDGNAAFSGGGFMPSQTTQTTDPSFSPAKNRDAQGLLPLTVKQISEVFQSSDDKANFLIDGVDVNNVKLVGMLCEKTERVTDVSFLLDDGTGRIDCHRWVNEAVDTKEMELLENGMYVKVHGHLKGFQGKKQLMVYSVRPLTDYNEIANHFAECIYDQCYNTKLRKQQDASQVPGHMPNSFGNTPSKGYQSTPSNHVSVQYNMDGVKGIDKMVLNYLQQPSCVGRKKGVHRSELVQQLNVTETKLLEAIESLESEDKRASQEILMDSENGTHVNNETTLKRQVTPKPLEENSSITKGSDSFKKRCKRKLDLDTKLHDSVSQSNCIRVYTRILRPNECMKNSRKLGPNFPFLFKKARKRRLRRTAFDKLIMFIGVVCVTPTIQKNKNAADPIKLVVQIASKRLLNWGIRRKRSNKKSKRKSDKKSSPFDDEEEDNVWTNQYYDLYTKALFDFSIQMIDGLHIDDVSNDFPGQMVDGLQSEDVKTNQLILSNQNQNGAIVVHKEKPTKVKARKNKEGEREVDNGRLVLSNKRQPTQKAKTKNMARKREEVDEGQLNKFISIMHPKQGHFSPWEGGSVVDYVVGLYLTQSCKKHQQLACSDPFVAFMNLRSRFLTDSALSISEVPFDDEVVPEQLLMVEKEGPTSWCSYSLGEVEVDSEDDDKEDTWDELCAKYATTTNRRSCNRDSIDWEAVRQTSFSDLAVILMKRGPNNLFAGTIKDFLNKIVKDVGSIDLEWLRDVPSEEAKKILISIPCLGLKKTKSTDSERVRGDFVASPPSLPALPSEGQ